MQKLGYGILAILWVLAYMAASLAMIGAAVYLWLFATIQAAEWGGPLAGLGLAACSFWGFVRYPEWVLAPWRFWHALWGHFDAVIERRRTSA